MKPWSMLSKVVALSFVGLFITQVEAAVERYKTEAGYLARLTELELDTVLEGFESAVWDGTRSTIVNPALESSVISQGILWEAAAKDVWGSQYSNRQHGLSTNTNWARSGTYGVYENHLGEPYPTTIRVSSPTPIFAVGGWFNTNPDLQSVGFLFEDRTTANDPGYFLPGFGVMYPGDNPSVGHEFVGIIDPDGISSVVLTGTLEVNEEGVLEGGTIFGADDFIFGVLPATLPGDLDGDGFVGIGDLNLVLGAWNQSVPPADPTTDPSGDGFVGIDDLNVVLGNWNTGTPPPPGAYPIPEPTGLSLIGIGVIIFLSKTSRGY